LGTGSETSRRQCRAAWQAWWQRNQSRIDLARLKQDDPLIGLTLIADLDSGTIVEVGADHQERWRATGFRGPVDVHLLSNGHILVAENHASQITERDKTGKIIWKKATSGLPGSCQRLPNGNTFIATTNLLVEITPDGKEVLRIHQEEGAYGARKLRNGNMVLATPNGKIVTLDSRGKSIRSFDSGGIVQWSMLDPLPNGHVLACCSTTKVTEFDATGKPVWSGSVPNPVCASRLPNGHILACDSEGRRVVEVDRAGNVVWEHKTKGRPWCVSRR
jgi:outer membrane protein assembly factor BamB